MDEYMTREDCAASSTRILAKLESIEKRLFRDNGTLSIQTRIERHEQILRVLLWVTSVVIGAALTSAVLGLILLFRGALARGAV